MALVYRVSKRRLGAAHASLNFERSFTEGLLSQKSPVRSNGQNCSTIVTKEGRAILIARGLLSRQHRTAECLLCSTALA